MSEVPLTAIRITIVELSLDRIILKVVLGEVQVFPIPTSPKSTKITADNSGVSVVNHGREQACRISSALS